MVAKAYNNGFVLTGSRFLLYFNAGRPAAQTADRYTSPTNLMLNKGDIVPLMLKACPSVKDAWQEHLKFWEGKKAGDYNDIAVFAHHIVECYVQNKTKEIDDAFETIEQLIKDGSEEIRSIVVVGFIEDLQNIASHDDFGYKVFEPYLRPASRQGWNDIIEQWKGKSSLADVIREEIKREK